MPTGTASNKAPGGKGGKGGKGKGKGAKAPPRQLYYGPEERPLRSTSVPTAKLTRRFRMVCGEQMDGQGQVLWWSHKETPVLDFSDIELAPLDAQLRALPSSPSKLWSSAEREANFRSHWAFRPKRTHALSLRQESADMRPFVERMLEQIAERRRRERLEAEAERLRLKHEKKGRKGKKGKGGPDVARAEPDQGGFV